MSRPEQGAARRGADTALDEAIPVHHGFRLVGIDHAIFERWFDLTDAQLKARHAERRVATANRGFPCRFSLEDARDGEELLLLHDEHHPADSPYRASGPILVRRGAQRRVLASCSVPEYVTSRLISVRAYDAAQTLVSANVCAGHLVEDEIASRFEDPDVAYLQLHNAKQGCFSCLVVRA